MEHQDKDKLAKSKGNAVKAFVSCALIGGVVGVSSLVATAAGVSMLFEHAMAPSTLVDMGAVLYSVSGSAIAAGGLFAGFKVRKKSGADRSSVLGFLFGSVAGAAILWNVGMASLENAEKAAQDEQSTQTSRQINNFKFS